MPEDHDLRAAALRVLFPVSALDEIGESVLERMIGRRFVIGVGLFAPLRGVVPGDHTGIRGLGACLFSARLDVLVCGGAIVVTGYVLYLFVRITDDDETNPRRRLSNLLVVLFLHRVGRRLAVVGNRRRLFL